MSHERLLAFQIARCRSQLTELELRGPSTRRADGTGTRRIVGRWMRERTPAGFADALDFEAGLTFEGAFRGRVVPAADRFLDAVRAWETEPTAVNGDAILAAAEQLLGEWCRALWPALEPMCDEELS